jgi:hypothetical protein
MEANEFLVRIELDIAVDLAIARIAHEVVKPRLIGGVMGEFAG